MKETILKEVKKGFTMNRWAIECVFGAVILMFTWMQLNTYFERTATPLRVIAILYFVGGVALLVFGRKTLTKQAKMIKDSSKSSAEEKWFSEEILGIENKDSHEFLLVKIGKSNPVRAREIQKITKDPGILGRYFGIGVLYAKNNFFVDYAPVAISVLIAVGYTLFIK